MRPRRQSSFDGTAYTTQWIDQPDKEDLAEHQFEANMHLAPERERLARESPAYKLKEELARQRIKQQMSAFNLGPQDSYATAKAAQAAQLPDYLKTSNQTPPTKPPAQQPQISAMPPLARASQTPGAQQSASTPPAQQPPRQAPPPSQTQAQILAALNPVDPRMDGMAQEILRQYNMPATPAYVKAISEQLKQGANVFYLPGIGQLTQRGR